MELLIIEADDPARMFAEFGSFRDPFDVWFRAVLADVYGLDLTQPPPGPPPEQLLDWSRRPGCDLPGTGRYTLIGGRHRRTSTHAEVRDDQHARLSPHARSHTLASRPGPPSRRGPSRTRRAGSEPCP